MSNVGYLAHTFVQQPTQNDVWSTDSLPLLMLLQLSYPP